VGSAAQVLSVVWAGSAVSVGSAARAGPAGWEAPAGAPSPAPVGWVAIPRSAARSPTC
jgi:hypothetical protein